MPVVLLRSAWIFPIGFPDNAVVDQPPGTAWLATGNSLDAARASTKQFSSVCAHDTTRTVGSFAATGHARRRVTSALMLRKKAIAFCTCMR